MRSFIIFTHEIFFQLKIRKDKMCKACGMYQREQKYILGIDQEAYGKIPLKRCWHMWKDNITMDLTETGWDGMYWIHSVQDKDKWLL